jgi:hypothetical protein
MYDSRRAPPRALVFNKDNQVRAFTGSPEQFEWLNHDVPIALSDDNVAEYVRVRLHFRAGDERLRIVDTAHALLGWAGEDEVERLTDLIEPVRTAPREEGGWTVSATALADVGLVRASVPVDHDGSVGHVGSEFLSAVRLRRRYPALGLDGEAISEELRARLELVHGRWDVLDEVDAESVGGEFPLELGAEPDAPLFRRGLSCYPGWDLVRMPHTMLREYAFCLHRPGEPLVATRGQVRSLWIRLNPRGLSIDTEARALEYLRFFTWFIGTPEHRWLLLDDPEHLPLAADASVDRSALEAAWTRPHAVPLRDDDPDDALWRIRATVLSGPRVIFSEFRVDEGGGVEMTDSEELTQDLDLDAELLDRLHELPPLGPRTPRSRVASPDHDPPPPP